MSYIHEKVSKTEEVVEEEKMNACQMMGERINNAFAGKPLYKLENGKKKVR